MKVTTKLNYANLNRVKENSNKAVALAAEATLTDIITYGSLPWATGKHIEASTHTDLSNVRKGKASIVTNVVFARRLYYHPEYFFNKEHNARAGGEWFKPWISGTKSKFFKNAYVKLLRRFAK